MTLPDDALVTVCDKCYRACCWQGEFMRERAYGDAGTVDVSVKRLREAQAGEHEDYWLKDERYRNDPRFQLGEEAKKLLDQLPDGPGVVPINDGKEV